ncbi:MAG: hypothetical protein DRI83_12210, partial [Bacteroidetes bacterium]
EAPLNDYVYVALLDGEGEPYYYQKHLFTTVNSVIQIETDQIPAQVGIDPFYLLIDRDLENNIFNVEEADENMIQLNMDAMVKSIAIIDRN